MDWLQLIDKDLYCTKNEKVVECISKAYDYGLIHIPLVENRELLGLIDFYKLAGIIGGLRESFSKISCKDIGNAITRTRVLKQEKVESVIRRMTLGNYTSMGVSSEPKIYEGTITARSLAIQLIHKYLSRRKIGEVASSRIGIVGSGVDLYQVLSVISRRRQPCVIVFNGYDIDGVICLDDVMYMLSQFEGSLPLYEATTREVVKTPSIVDASLKLGSISGLNAISEPVLVSENGEIIGLLTIEDILSYSRKIIVRQ